MWFNFHHLCCTFSEQEILDVIQDSSENSSFLRKDTVFARMSFALKTGSFRLVENAIGETGELLCCKMLNYVCSLCEKILFDWHKKCVCSNQCYFCWHAGM